MKEMIIDRIKRPFLIQNLFLEVDRRFSETTFYVFCTQKGKLLPILCAQMTSKKVFGDFQAIVSFPELNYRKDPITESEKLTDKRVHNFSKISTSC